MCRINRWQILSQCREMLLVMGLSPIEIDTGEATTSSTGRVSENWGAMPLCQ